MKFTYLSLVVFLQISLSGCISDPKHVEDDFGLSVKQMVAAQIYDPAAASQPDAIPPLVIDGDVAGTGVDGYREAAERKEKASSNVIFSVE